MRTLALTVFFVFAGCGTAMDSSTGSGGTNALTGTWLSQGSDVAPLLAAAPFNDVSITATFNGDDTYSVDSVDTSNKHVTFSGTYELTPSSVSGILSITCHQVEPQTATAEGMLQIDGTVTPARMQYEVVQTQPTNGLTPPVPERGFGSTLFNGQPINTLIQNYSRQ